jgi:hypothetical protein
MFAAASVTIPEDSFGGVRILQPPGYLALERAGNVFDEPV